MKILKMLLALLLAAGVVLSLAACGGGGERTSKKDGERSERSGRDSRDDGEDEDEDDDRGSRKKAGGYGLYIRDGELFYSDLSRDGTFQLTTRFYEDADNYDLVNRNEDFSRATVVSRDGKTIFFPDKIDRSGSALYCRSTASGKKDAAKIDSDVTLYFVSDDGRLVTYLKNGNLYQYDVDRDEKSAKLASEVYSLYVSGDGERILYRDRENTLYRIDGGNDETKLDGDVDNIWAVSGDCETAVYEKDGALYITRGGEKVRITSELSNVIYAYGTGEAYYTKEGGGTALYYFDGETSEAVTDEFRDYWSNHFYPAYDIPLLAYQDAGGAYWLAVGAEARELDAAAPLSFTFTFSTDGGSFWFVDEPDGNGVGELYHVPISDGGAGRAEKVDEDVDGYYLLYDAGHLFYCKDVSNGEGELYIDGEHVDGGVCLSRDPRWSEDGALLYFTEHNDSKGCGTLKQYSDGETAKIADDVTNAFYMPDGSVLYLADYNSGKYRGDLYVYSGGESTLLDEDVTAILPVNGNQRGLVSVW